MSNHKDLYQKLVVAEQKLQHYYDELDPYYGSNKVLKVKDTELVIDVANIVSQTTKHQKVLGDLREVQAFIEEIYPDWKTNGLYVEEGRLKTKGTYTAHLLGGKRDKWLEEYQRDLQMCIAALKLAMKQ